MVSGDKGGACTGIFSVGRGNDPSDPVYIVNCRGRHPMLGVRRVGLASHHITMFCVTNDC